MKCLQFANRLKLLEKHLPNVMVDIVDGYVGNEMIPLAVIPLPRGETLIGVIGFDIYTYDQKVMKRNEEVIARNVTFNYGSVQKVTGDWILYGRTLYNVVTKKQLTFTKEHRSLTAFHGCVYYLYEYQVGKLDMDTMNHVFIHGTYGVLGINVIGDQLVFAFRDAFFRFVDDATKYESDEWTNMHWIYKWNGNVYAITDQSIIRLDGDTVVFEDPQEYIRYVFAREEYLFLVYVSNNVWILNLNTFHAMPCTKPPECLLKNLYMEDATSVTIYDW